MIALISVRTVHNAVSHKCIHCDQKQFSNAACSVGIGTVQCYLGSSLLLSPPLVAILAHSSVSEMHKLQFLCLLLPQVLIKHINPYSFQ